MGNPYADANSRHVSRWLERKVKELIQHEIRRLTAELRAERERHGLPRG